MVNDNDTSQELEDIARAFKQDKDTQPIEQDLSPNPTPKPTAEAMMSQISYEGCRAGLLFRIRDEVNRATRKAFEEAAALLLRRAKELKGVRGLIAPHLDSAADELFARSRE